MALGARCVDALLHKVDSHAASAPFAVDGERSQEQCGCGAHRHRPEAHRTVQRTIFDRDETEARLGIDAFPQAIGGLGVAPRPEAAFDQRVDGGRVRRPFFPDLPHARFRLFYGLASAARLGSKPH